MLNHMVFCVLLHHRVGSWCSHSLCVCFFILFVCFCCVFFWGGRMVDLLTLGVSFHILNDGNN